MASCSRGDAPTPEGEGPAGPPMVAAGAARAEMVIQDEGKKNDEQAAHLDGGVAAGEESTTAAPNWAGAPARSPAAPRPGDGS